MCNGIHELTVSETDDLRRACKLLKSITVSHDKSCECGLCFAAWEIEIPDDCPQEIHGVTFDRSKV